RRHTRLVSDWSSDVCSSDLIGLPLRAAFAKNERLAAMLLAKAARKGNPIAQNRLANILAAGRGANPNPMQAIKWHIIAKAGGVSDVPLDAFVQQQPPDVRAAGEKAAKPLVDALKELRASRS